MPARDEVDVANVLLTKARGDEAGLRALSEHRPPSLAESAGTVEPV